MTLRSSLVLALSGLFVVLALRACWENHRLDQLRAENAQLRSEAAQSRLEAHGYQTTLAHVTAHLRRTLAERDHWRTLASEPDAEPVAFVVATAEAESRVEGEARIVEGAGETAEGSGVIHFPGFEGIAQDDVFAVRWRLLLFPSPPRFEADVRARIPVELVAYRLPDDAIGVTAVSPDPRVRVDVETFYWQPPKQREPSRLRWLLAGVAIGVVGWEAIR